MWYSASRMPNSVGVIPWRAMFSVLMCSVTALNARAITTSSLSAVSCFRSSDAEVEAPFWARVEVAGDFILELRYIGATWKARVGGGWWDVTPRTKRVRLLEKG